MTSMIYMNNQKEIMKSLVLILCKEHITYGDTDIKHITYQQLIENEG